MSAKKTIFSKTNHEVYVLTAMGQPASGFLATWVLPASLQAGPPRIVVLVSPLNYTAELMAVSKRFVLHMLAADQADYMMRFGYYSGRDRDKWDGIEVQASDYGPVLQGTCGYGFCDIVATYDLGERHLVVADIQYQEHDAAQQPLRKQEALAALEPRYQELLMKKHGDLAQQSLGLWKDVL